MTERRHGVRVRTRHAAREGAGRLDPFLPAHHVEARKAFRLGHLARDRRHALRGERPLAGERRRQRLGRRIGRIALRVAGIYGQVAAGVQTLSQDGLSPAQQLRTINRWHPPLHAVCSAIQQETGYGCFVTGFVTPAGERGLNPHWDQNMGFIYQVAGRKTWQIWEPVVEHPHRDHLASNTPPGSGPAWKGTTSGDMAQRP